MRGKIAARGRRPPDPGAVGSHAAPVYIPARRRDACQANSWEREFIHAGLPRSMAEPNTPDLKDITIIGAGPTGLFGAFYAGMRGASCRLIDSLPALGGQLMALYPEKYIYDVAGFPKVLAKDLVAAMGDQALQFGAEVRLGETVTSLERIDGEAGQFHF